MTDGVEQKKVVYLLGAGASHACVDALGSPHGILMSHLRLPLAEQVRELVLGQYKGDSNLTDLVNEVFDDETDFEHLITFLGESPSALHRKFADDLRKTFESVLRQKLETIEKELGRAPTELFEALLDMYMVSGLREELVGVLTINYDEYMEDAIGTIFNKPPDFGIHIQGTKPSNASIRLLKLHGSFGWRDAWPIPLQKSDTPLWIPPGIQKAKDRYPFNVLWGLARELLDCDVLRIVGCRLGPNDWDLISLIFTTRHATSIHRPYVVEVIDAPLHAAELQKSFPYLNVQSILEIEPIGRQLISELLGDVPRPYTDLTLEEQKRVKELAGRNRNWLRLWLKQMAEALYRDLGSIKTPLGALERLMETY
jgi:hypothetical protein